MERRGGQPSVKQPSGSQAMVVREAFFLGVFLVVFKNWRFCIWAFFSRFPEIGVFFLAFFFKDLKIGVFNLGVFFRFSEIGVFFLAFFWAFFL